MIIYKTTNLINGKIYVGQHNTSADDGYLGSGKILKQAIKKYRRNNFDREILEKGIKDKITLNEREVFWIAELGARDRNIGYNITSGGDGGMAFHNLSKERQIELRKLFKELSSGRKHTVESRKKMSIANRGRKVSEETRKKMSIVKRGKKASEETRKKMSIANRGNKNAYGTKRSDVIRRRMSESLRKVYSIKERVSQKYKYCLISPEGVKYDNITLLKQFCEKRGMNSRSMRSALEKGRSKYKGWMISRSSIQLYL